MSFLNFVAKIKLTEIFRFLFFLLTTIDIIIDKFLHTRVSLNKNKIFVRKINQGIDLLDYMVLLHYRILRTKIKKRIFKKLKGSLGKLNSTKI